ncbi:decapping and exoribonuclease protein-like [Sycon ciliatum]|uniref:decapping and exoribonuclease protein-like n=1 Tax=Sycon ciliatum TaxID=27933 RepID=UPI0031F6985F
MSAATKAPASGAKNPQLLIRRRADKSDLSLRPPVEIGCFSMDDKRAIFMDRREARRCVEVPDGGLSSLAWDLNEGSADFQWRDEDNIKAEGIKPLLEWIMANNTVLKEFPDTTFVLKRGVMKDVLTTPYELEARYPKEWRVKVCRFRNVIYLCKDVQFPKWDSFSSLSPRDQQTTHWGFRFESYCTAPITPEAELNSRPNDTAGFHTVVYTQLAEHCFILAGEVDGELDRPGQSPPSNSNYVEMKIQRELAKPQHRETFHRRKLLNAWAQCYCSGVPNLLIGFRDDDGIVHSVKSYKTADLPRMCRDYWSDSGCLNFAKDLFDWLWECIEETDPLQVQYEVTFQPPFTSITLRKVKLDDKSAAVLTPEFVETKSAAKSE